MEEIFKSDFTEGLEPSKSLILSQMCIPISRSNTLSHHPFEHPDRFELSSLGYKSRIITNYTKDAIVGDTGFEPMTSCLLNKRSEPTELISKFEALTGFEPASEVLQTSAYNHSATVPFL